MLTCRDCFHYDVCGCESNDVVVDMCKAFVKKGEVLYGPALKIVSDDLDRTKDRVYKLERELKYYEFQNQDLQREVDLLRIIKQTLEMQSGMKFDI